MEKSFKISSLPACLLLLALLGCAGHRPVLTEKTAEVPETTPDIQASVPTSTPMPPAPADKPAAKPASRPVTLAFVGDILLGGSALPKLNREGPDSFFIHVKDLLAEADLAVGNLEGPLGSQGEVYVDKQYTFLTPPEAAQGLKNAGFRILTLANNHAMDFGPQALDSTLSALDALGLKHSGAGDDEASARRPAVLEVADRKVAVLAYSLTYPSEFWAGPQKPGCAQGDGYSIREDVAAARASGAQLVIVCLHWGQEGKTVLRGYQPALARVALEAGADAVIGHHPHIWQALGVIGGKPVAYSLGNFVFGSYSQKAVRSGILYLTFDGNNRWSGGKVIPLNVHNGSVQFSPRPLAGAEGRKFCDHLAVLSKPQGARLTWDGAAIHWIPPTPKP